MCIRMITFLGNPKPESVWCPHCRGATKVTLKWQRSIWEGDQEVVKRSGKDESIWVEIHLCMEAMLGISLYSYSYLKLAKTLCLPYYCLWLLFNKIGEKGRTGSAWKQGWWGERERVGGGERNDPNNVCTYEYMNKQKKTLEKTIKHHLEERKRQIKRGVRYIFRLKDKKN
jgi:hypothetical protein